MPVCEMYYTVVEVSCLLRLHPKTVLKLIHAQDLGLAVANLGGSHRPDYRVPASAVNAYLERHRVFDAQGIPARTVGELRRKVKQHVAPSFGTGGITSSHPD